jgi:hypothetical protein
MVTMLGDAHLSSIGIRSGLLVIVETLTNQACKNLRDVAQVDHPEAHAKEGFCLSGS